MFIDVRHGLARLNRGLACALLLLVTLACQSGSDRAQADPAPSKALQEIAIDPADPNLAFIWIDKEGNFQTTTDRSEIPAESRNPVRVLGHPEATSDPSHVLVIDLDPTRPSKARPMARDEWENQGKSLRQARIDAARPRPTPPSAIAEGGLSAIVYGADWCKPCHMAEDYLKQKGVQVTKKDIEEDAQASSEMRAKLAKAGLSGASIPVLDVGGTILVGFSTSAVDRALERALRK